MRIMVIGAQSAGKSTFAEKLGHKLSLPVIHLDALVNAIGRDNTAAGEALIRTEADKPEWILDGNSFTRDRSYRLEKADYVIMFTMTPFKSFVNHIQRWWQERRDTRSEKHGHSKGLNLAFSIDFAFKRWPAREKEILNDIKDMNKKVFFIRNFKEADEFLTRDLIK